jgi:Zn-dependent M28 family amino/carboxypeptidase
VLKRVRTPRLAAILASLLLLATAAGVLAARVAYEVTAVTQPLVRQSAEAITAKELKDYLTFVASDEMEGRADPSRGLDTTADFLAMMLSRDGVQPAGDDGYFQRITLEKDRVVPEGTVVELDGRSFRYGTDFLASGAGGSVKGAMVFAGNGWYVKAKGIDAYDQVDPKGKVVLITQGSLPGGVSLGDLVSGSRGEDWIDPATYARQKGAIAIVMLVASQAVPATLERQRRAAEEGRYFVQKLPHEEPLPVITANKSLVEALLGDSPEVMASLSSTPVRPFALPASRRISFTIHTITETTRTQNVVAVVEGSDPVLCKEYVALGAHYDHLPPRTGSGGDRIYNGADDDGSGTVALLSIAEALTKAPRHPKRSVLFVWHMGEEMGLWGSEYYTTFPTVPLDKIVAQLNIDMIGRTRAPGDTDARDRNLSGPDELYVIGSRMMSTQLGELSEAVNAAYLKLKFNYKYDDPDDPERFFYRSDHINYARKGIPIIFYFTGVHADYHQVGDEVSKIDFAKYEKITRTIYATMWEIGEMASRPVVDKPLDDRSYGLW